MSVRPFHHQRPLFAVAACYGLGIWAGVRFFWRPGLWLAGLAACGLAIGLLPRVGKRRIAGAMGLFLFLGALLGGWASHPAMPEPGTYQVTAVVSGNVVLREDGTAAGYLEQVRAENAAGSVALPRAYWTYTPAEDAPFLPLEGDRVAFSGRLYAPQGQVNPYGFDFRMFLLQKGVSMWISGAAEGQILDRPGRGLASLTYRARLWLERRLNDVFGDGSALPQALLIGLRDQLPQEVRQSFADAGVAHLLAVSGLHVGLLAYAVMLVLRRWLSPGALLGVMAALLLGYCALLDFSAPVVRASVLLVLAQARRMARRAPDPITTLAAAFLLILLARPLDLFSASFQLSFLAVLGIAVFEPVIRRPLEKRLPAILGRGISVTLSATIGVFLPTVQIYHRFSLAGPLINPALCAVFAVLLPTYALVLALGCVYLPAGAFLARGLNAAAGLILQGIEKVASLPFATVRVPYLPWYCVAALGAAAVLASRYVVWPGKRRAALAVCLVAAAFGVWPLTVCRDVQYIQLAAGQADCAVILDGSQTVVVDTGEDGGDLAAFLLATGRKADQLILTHLHRDHCLGVRELLEARVPIGCVYLPEGARQQQIDEECVGLVETLQESGIPVIFLCAGDRIETARVRVEVTWPQGGRVRPGQDANRYALAMLLDLDGLRLLSASDLPGEYERYAAREADVLKVAHHGSKNSTGMAFLSIVAPRAAFITGSWNGAALPHADTLERLRQINASVYNTGTCGAILLTVRQGEGEITTFLRENNSR